jgi:hypothetical protein
MTSRQLVATFFSEVRWTTVEADDKAPARQRSTLRKSGTHSRRRDAKLCSTVHQIFVNVSQYCKCCARWMSRVPTDENEASEMLACLSFLQRSAVQARIRPWTMTAGDKTWIYQFTSVKPWSGNTPQPHSSPTWKLVATSPVGKMLASFFWNSSGVCRLLLQIRTLTGYNYCHLTQAIRWTRSGHLGDGEIVLHDDTRSHTGTAHSELAELPLRNTASFYITTPLSVSLCTGCTIHRQPWPPTGSVSRSVYLS